MSHENQPPSFDKAPGTDQHAGSTAASESAQPGGRNTNFQSYGQQSQYGYGQPDQTGYGQPGPGQYPTARPTNTFAILALVLAFVFAPLGIIFGVLAKRQIRVSGESGSGLAQAGFIIGIVFTALGALYFLAIFGSVFIPMMAGGY